MKRIPLSSTVVEAAVRERNIETLRKTGVLLPAFSELAEPATIQAPIKAELGTVDPQTAHPLNLFRVHWHNSRRDRSFTAVPEHVVLPPSLTGVDARIVVLFGNRFPIIGAHKVLAAYVCLAPRIATGQFDLTRHRAVWPSTGNYCRGGVAISRILGCRGVAVLPAGMSAERFRWLEQWTTEPSDIVRTPGTEANVKEIYDACKTLERDPENVIFNQFAELGNYLIHYRCTGAAIGRVFDSLTAADPSLRLRGFVAASGSGGTLGAGDFLKDRYGSVTVAVEAAECPTMLNNGFGDHNIQGIGDKHIPYIHNVMNTDVVVAVSDRSTDSLNVLFNTQAGRELLASRHSIPAGIIEHLGSFGLSSICNVLAAIKTAKYYKLGTSDVVATVATDGSEMYASELEKTLGARFNGRFDAVDAAGVYGQHMLGAATDNLAELSVRDRERIFNLGYFTWVEQHDFPIPEFKARRSQSYWRDLQQLLPAWDAMIENVNVDAGTKR
ncbi:MAG TPA: pyridoxal-phosphate dependent enzyme, partial [Thermoanaerobaculia bacterium]|nr:pyridoxal-phosphate dependent enzyme [Thermoanaerobaculia bacterium]